MEVRHDGAGLLRQAGLVDALDGVPGGQGGVGEQPVGGDDAGAADAGRVDAVAAVDGGDGGSGSSPAGSAGRSAPAPAPARRTRWGVVGDDGQERRAVALQAGEVLVAGRLVDLAALAELGLDGQHGEAVADPRAVAAALAHRLVDHDPLRRLVELAPLARRRASAAQRWS